jgi:hypothetical protein
MDVDDNAGKTWQAVLWSRSRKESELFAGAGAGILKFRLQLWVS